MFRPVLRPVCVIADNLKLKKKVAYVEQGAGQIENQASLAIAININR